GFIMSEYINLGKIQVAKKLYDFVNEEALEDAELKQDKFWNDFQQIVSDFTPRNEELLKERQNIQDKIDAWHKENKNIENATNKNCTKNIKISKIKLMHGIKKIKILTLLHIKIF